MKKFTAGGYSSFAPFDPSGYFPGPYQLHDMARRNRKSRKAAATANANREVKLTEEDKAQERSFFIWVGVITLVIVGALFWVLA